MLCSPKIWETLNFILSVLINAMPQRYAAMKYFPCSRLAFFSIFQRQTVAEINFPLFWCGVKHEIYFSGRREQWEWKSSRFIRVYVRKNKVVVPPWNSIETTRSPMKITSRENFFVQRASAFSRSKFSLSMRGIVLLTRTTFDWVLQQRRFVIYALE